MRILVTAGPTCEDLDPVRFLTNRSSGRVGYAIAAEAARRGHEVVCVSGPTALDNPADVEVVRVRSAADMLAASLEQFPSCQAAVLTAAVADYTPAEVSPTKLKKSGDDLTLKLVRTADIAQRLAAMKTDQVIVGFAMEDAPGRAAAEAKLQAKNWDAAVLNRPETFGSDTISADLFSEAAWTELGPLSKAAFATRLLDQIEQLAQKDR
jgi:phosphopantothenoylcysteine decarboxylase / phosphopantothenate---cysteine ligase